MLKLHDSLAAETRRFKPLQPKKTKIYACGPTVYDFAHLGNLRTYIFEDILRRTLEYNNYKVKQAVNITDIDDKIIDRAKKENKNFKEITRKFAKAFFEDLKKLNVKKADYYPKATGYIKKIIGLVKTLVKKGFAYKGKDGSVYFSVAKFKNYGALSGLKKRKLKIGARIEADEYNKKEAADFVLWKKAKTEEPSWPSPWGPGRPGWHIECSAMSMERLGETFDIHAGGVDLIFPHHENEIAQSEAATGKKFVNYWIHGEHLLIDGQKMSKSLGNFFTLRDLESANGRKKFNPLAFRYLVLTSHYRSKLNFTWQSLESAQNALDNLINIIGKTAGGGKQKISDEKRIKTYERKFLNAVNDDLNTPKAVAILWQTVKDEKLAASAKKRLILKFDEILGLGLNKSKKTKIPLKITQMADEREKLRADKQFIQADALRKKMEALGYVIEDTAAGPKISKK